MILTDSETIDKNAIEYVRDFYTISSYVVSIDQLIGPFDSSHNVYKTQQALVRFVHVYK